MGDGNVRTHCQGELLLGRALVEQDLTCNAAQEIWQTENDGHHR